MEAVVAGVGDKSGGAPDAAVALHDSLVASVAAKLLGVVVDAGSEHVGCNGFCALHHKSRDDGAFALVDEKPGGGVFGLHRSSCGILVARMAGDEAGHGATEKGGSVALVPHDEKRPCVIGFGNVAKEVLGEGDHRVVAFAAAGNGDGFVDDGDVAFDERVEARDDGGGGEIGAKACILPPVVDASLDCLFVIFKIVVHFRVVHVGEFCFRDFDGICILGRGGGRRRFFGGSDSAAAPGAKRCFPHVVVEAADSRVLSS